LWGYILMGLFWLGIWYSGSWGWLQNLIEYGGGTLVRGHGFVPGSMSPGLSWAMWAVFTVGPLPVVRGFLWNVLGWEYVTVTSGGLVVERKILGIPVYRQEVYDLGLISNLRSEGLPSKKNPDAPDLFRPNRFGAIAFDYGEQTIRFGYSLFANRELARDIAAGLDDWVVRARKSSAAVPNK